MVKMIYRTFCTLGRVLSRERTKDVTLDYAQGHGVEVAETVRCADRQESSPPPPLTPEREAAARQRLAARAHAMTFRSDLTQAAQQLDLALSPAQAGDQGWYCGRITLAGQSYGVVQLNVDRGVYLPLERLKERRWGQGVILTRVTDHTGPVTCSGSGGNTRYSQGGTGCAIGA